MRPFQVFGVDAAPAVVEKRHFVGHCDRDIGFERSRVAATGTPGHGEPAAHNGLLFLGNKLIQEPKPGKRRTGELARLLRRRSAEDLQEIVNACPAIIGDGFDLRRSDVGVVEPGNRFPRCHHANSRRPPPASIAKANASQITAFGSLNQRRRDEVSGALPNDRRDASGF